TAAYRLVPDGATRRLHHPDRDGPEPCGRRAQRRLQPTAERNVMSQVDAQLLAEKAVMPNVGTQSEQATAPLLEMRRLNVHFRGSQGHFHAVKNLDLSIGQGETVALVGESGCGKSTTALAIMQLLAPGASLKGEIDFAGRNLAALSQSEMRKVRGREISMIFQEPMTSLNPVHTIGAQIMEVLRLHEGLSRQLG